MNFFRHFAGTLCLGLALILTTASAISSNKSEVHGNCCLCMCGAKDETKCSAMCVRLQHSKQIVELPAMNACTTECKRVHVEVTK